MAYPPPPYKDAVAGTFVAGEAIAGTWWAYPPQPNIGLQAIPPGVVIVNADTDITITPPTALLGLAGTTPTLGITQILAVLAALLGLTASPPTRVGFVWLPTEEDVLGPWNPTVPDTLTPVASAPDSMIWLPTKAD